MPASAVSSPDGVPIDGRRARRERSREQVVDAVLDLLDEGVLRPTAQMVAERSGISLRSIFRIFDDVQTLHEAATTRHLERVGHLFQPISAEGDLRSRIETTTQTLSELYEVVGPIRRAAMRLAPESEVFADRIRSARGWLRGELERIFGLELTDTTPDVAASLEVLCSFEAWDQLRRGQGLDVETARATVVASVARILS